MIGRYAIYLLVSVSFACIIDVKNARDRLAGWKSQAIQSECAIEYLYREEDEIGREKVGAYLCRQQQSLSMSQIRKLCAAKHVTVQGQPVFYNQVLNDGDLVIFTTPTASGESREVSEVLLVKITKLYNHLYKSHQRTAPLYEDDHMAVVFKPAGIHTLPWKGTRAKKGQLTFADILPMIVSTPTTTGAGLPLPLPLPAPPGLPSQRAGDRGKDETCIASPE